MARREDAIALRDRVSRDLDHAGAVTRDGTNRPSAPAPAGGVARVFDMHLTGHRQCEDPSFRWRNGHRVGPRSEWDRHGVYRELARTEHFEPCRVPGQW